MRLGKKSLQSISEKDFNEAPRASTEYMLKGI